MQRVDPVKPSNSGTIVRSLGPDATPGRQVRFSRLTYQYVRNPWHVPVLEPLAQAPPMRSDLAVARVPQSVRSIMDGNPPRLSLITTPFTHRSLYAWGLLAWAYCRTRSWSHRRPPIWAGPPTRPTRVCVVAAGLRVPRWASAVRPPAVQHSGG
jgi:hypothetical protein